MAKLLKSEAEVLKDIDSIAESISVDDLMSYIDSFSSMDTYKDIHNDKIIDFDLLYSKNNQYNLRTNDINTKKVLNYEQFELGEDYLKAM